MPSTDRGLSPSHRGELLGLARRAIETGLDGGRLDVPLGSFPEPLREVRATFVTLKIGGRLRGCMGTLEARRPLVEDVAWNAYAAAFEDPRFPPLARAEVASLDVSLSLLSLPEPMRFGSEQELVAQIRPNIDGLVLEEGPWRGTFLPSVWQQLPDAGEFLRHLKRKAGLPVDYWSATLCVSRYTAELVP
ncbi:MAG: AmmeMemoRadiSam system protein A [Acidobacteriota bacterium]|nr:AmmeMemoRadiSam system protein A [Acidobacteriota bacterium]